MEMVSEDMYLTTVAVPVLAIEVYSRTVRGTWESALGTLRRGGLAKPGCGFFRTEVTGKKSRDKLLLS